MITTYTYDKANRLKTVNAGGSVTTYTHDPAGNLIRKQTPIELTEYTWDARGEMVNAEVTAGTVNFSYNADGQRVSKESTDGSIKGFLYDYKKLLAETDDVGGEITKSYDTTSDQEFGDLISEDGDSFYYQFDAQANANALLDELGTVRARFKYDAFGRLANSSVEGDAWSTLSVDDWATMSIDQWATLPVELATALNWGAKKQYYRDEELELYLLGFQKGRHYDGDTGRFISEDPTRQNSGDPNLYPYVQNNPINKLDPSGHEAAFGDQNGNEQAGKDYDGKPKPTTQPSSTQPSSQPTTQPTTQPSNNQPPAAQAPPSDPAPTTQPSDPTPKKYGPTDQGGNGPTDTGGSGSAKPSDDYWKRMTDLASRRRVRHQEYQSLQDQKELEALRKEHPYVAAPSQTPQNANTASAVPPQTPQQDNTDFAVAGDVNPDPYSPVHTQVGNDNTVVDRSRPSMSADNRSWLERKWEDVKSYFTYDPQKHSWEDNVINKESDSYARRAYFRIAKPVGEGAWDSTSLVRHPIDTAAGIRHATMHPVETAGNIKEKIEEFKNSSDIEKQDAVTRFTSSMVAGGWLGGKTSQLLKQVAPVLKRAGNAAEAATSGEASKVAEGVVADSGTATRGRTIKLNEGLGKETAGEFNPDTGTTSINRQGVRNFAATSGKSIANELATTGYHEAFHRALAPIDRFVGKLMGVDDIYRNL